MMRDVPASWRKRVRERLAISVSGLEFREGPHEYFLYGARYPSVTQILDSCGFYRWLPDGNTDARDRGTVVHEIALLDDAGILDESSVEDDLRGYVDAYREAKSEIGIEYLAREVKLAHRKRKYAGRLDGIAARRESGKLAIVDLKTTEGEAEAYWRLQTAAYADMLPESVRFERFAIALSRTGKWRCSAIPPTRQNAEDLMAWRS